MDTSKKDFVMADVRKKYDIAFHNQVKAQAIEKGFTNKLGKRGRVSTKRYIDYINEYNKNNNIQSENLTNIKQQIKSNNIIETKKQKILQKENQLKADTLKLITRVYSLQDSYKDLKTVASLLNMQSVGKKLKKSDLLSYIQSNQNTVNQEMIKIKQRKQYNNENMDRAKNEAESLGFVRDKNRKGKISLKEYNDFISQNKNIVVDSDTKMEYIDNLQIEFTAEKKAINKKYDVNSYIINVVKNIIFHKGSQIDIIVKLIDKFIVRIKTEQQLNDNDRLSLAIFNNASNRFLGIPYTKVVDFNAEIIATKIVRRLNSNESFFLEGVTFSFSYIRSPKGGARYIMTNLSEEEISKKRCIISIKNKDNSCFVIALSIAIEQLKKVNGEITLKRFQNLCQFHNKTSYIKQCQELYKQVDIPVDTQISFGDIYKFEKLLKITINVFTIEGPAYPYNLDNQFEKQIYLFYHNNHYDVITSPEAFLNVSHTADNFFCQLCKNVCPRRTHKCSYSGKSLSSLCTRCNTKHLDGDLIIQCPDCLFEFTTQACYDKHRSSNNGKRSICEKLRICRSCGVVIHKKYTEEEYNNLPENKKKQAIKSTHLCEKFYCEGCNSHVSKEEHKCYIKNLNQKDRLKYAPKQKIIFYDYETYQDENKEHIPNLVIIFRTNPENVNEYTEHMFSVFDSDNDNTDKYSVNKRFCTWLFNNSNKGYTCLAHNSKGYDIHFIKNYLYNNEIPIDYDVIDTGSKTMSLKVKKLKMSFIDSVNFFSSPLSELPKTYGLEEMKKGYFPHFFNRPENYNYSGIFPNKHFYGYSTMKVSNQKEFDTWFAQQKNKTFNFRDEFLTYCRSDVDILMRAWLKFRDIFINITKDLKPVHLNEDEQNEGVDPTNFITLASLCNAIYKNYFMPKKSIGILEENNINFSVSELEYLLYTERTMNILIDRQVKIGTYYVDGVHEQTKTVYEFLGCFWHGCKFCYHDEILNHQAQKSMKMLRKEWMIKKSFIESQGYNVVEMWSHKWDEMKKSSKDLRTFIKDNQELLRAPFCSMRESFFGGRTEVFDLYAKSTDDTHIGYADFTSLYPSVNYMERYPVGHPVRIRENINKDINEYFGFIYCKVKPNTNLRIPVLPNRGDGKLMFSNKNLVGVWCSEELKNALKYGYQIQEIYEVVHFPNSSTNLFSDYIRLFFKIKSECSFEGKTDDEKIKYINDLNTGSHPIQLDMNKLCFNSGIKQVAKLSLNSLWGKFGQRANMTQTVIIKNDVNRFYKIIFDDKLIISSVNFLNEETAEIRFTYNTEFVDKSKNTNIAIASFTTAYARTWLYKALDKVGFNNVHYCDTDSIIYSYDKKNNPIKTDNKLGNMKDELSGTHITELICLAPKTYAYICENGKMEFKSKGFSLNADSIKEGLNFDTMKQMISELYNDRDVKTSKTIKYNDRIRLNQTSKRIHSLDESKEFKFTFTKRIIDFDNMTQNRISTIPKY